MSTCGMFITFEGVDGAGKTTQVNRLAEYWRAQGREVVTTREPGGTELGITIRKLLLGHDDADEPIAPRTEALLFAADRAQHVAQIVRPALRRGAIVISDRYFDSSIAYQAGGRELGSQEVRELSMWATGGLVPMRTYLLDIDPAESHKRMIAPEDRMESTGDDFQQRTRRAFLAMAAQEPDRFLVVDATASEDEVAEQILSDNLMLSAFTGVAEVHESVETEPAR
ncbi:dTMP kinase [Bifidobacterium choloepi]|uniref:Thymidylate kinase n=1 Tax=Bifidobacterium choloepi TaxID=2614131 RepID=A0A6I5NHM5_9BIFI|nr:dTMP kinase [Bifidobacterium choloepi]NEG69823.1 dTMP kinase [Bifidobacterium choloepi]